MTPIFELSSKLFLSSDVRGSENRRNHALRSGGIAGTGREMASSARELAFLPSAYLGEIAQLTSRSAAGNGSDSDIPKMGSAEHRLRTNSWRSRTRLQKGFQARFCEIAEKWHRLFLQSRKLPQCQCKAYLLSSSVRHAALLWDDDLVIRHFGSTKTEKVKRICVRVANSKDI